MGIKNLWGFFKKYKFLIIILLAGVVLVLLPTGKKEKSSAEPLKTQEFSLAAEEARMASAISQIDGAGKTTVVLTLREGCETVLAEDTELEYESGDGINEKKSASTVTVSAGSGYDEPVKLKTVYPVYQGALVVCAGAGDAGVRYEVVRAVAGLTGLSADKITVSKMKEE